MNTSVTVNSFDELHARLNSFKLAKYIWIYRGQSDASWELKPKIAREEYDIDGLGLGRFRAWKKKAVAYQDFPNNEWEKLAIAQHHGLATILLDWSENPLVGAYFAVSENMDKDGILYIHSPGKLIDEDKNPSPFEFEKWYPDYPDNSAPPSLGYYPKSINKRIINQKGVFTIHLKPHQVLKSYETEDPHMEQNLFSIRIKAEAKKDILKKLKKYGIDYHFLFSDLDGLSEFINRETKQIGD